MALPNWILNLDVKRCDDDSFIAEFDTDIVDMMRMQAEIEMKGSLLTVAMGQYSPILHKFRMTVTDQSLHQRIEQMPDSGRIVTEQLRVLSEGVPQSAQQLAATLESHQVVARGHLHALSQDLRVDVIFRGTKSDLSSEAPTTYSYDFDVDYGCFFTRYNRLKPMKSEETMHNMFVEFALGDIFKKS